MLAKEGFFQVGKDKQKQRGSKGKENHLQDCSTHTIQTICRLLTFTALFITCQLIARLTGAFVTAQCVLTVLLTPTIVWQRTFIHLCQEKTRTSQFPDHSNPLIFLMQHFWTERPEH